ncbi:protein of unknown function (plasmid) [Cupriavidus taiwanensis]|uniref:Uncharacterized protein n=1 Tax=Cupriavidus taiwanensis TaxID=164546 RepID=A0A375HG42_9BURK|nr:protein of unknown function [Cupriavidus taiwanensis]SOZ72416.1 protein of unknown function [Cupriavidus taiwanensis]SOZ74789.1 protein of unknown function [Cupriavidus taiwanensis]SPA03618.1 protein of unknown function [Cupriavidus taiwanensis]SPA11519.1 protein of unknown function [Cupriavidus taiwanensis]
MPIRIAKVPVAKVVLGKHPEGDNWSARLGSPRYGDATQRRGASD